LTAQGRRDLSPCPCSHSLDNAVCETLLGQHNLELGRIGLEFDSGIRAVLSCELMVAVSPRRLTRATSVALKMNTDTIVASRIQTPQPRGGRGVARWCER
jgi:hypothetical protein